MTDHQPDLCPACHHPKAHHTAGSLCTGWHGVSHSCPAYTDEHIERRDATAALDRDRTISDDAGEWPGWTEDLNPRELGESPTDYAARLEQLAGVITETSTNIADRFPAIDPDDQATHPARNPHDLTVAASALRGASSLADSFEVAEWLEQLAQQFDTERENLT